MLNGTGPEFTYGADYPGTKLEYGQASQFATTMRCGGPFGSGSTGCPLLSARRRGFPLAQRIELNNDSV